MKKAFVSIILFLSILILKGQGCSDAGGCSIGSVDFLETEDKPNLQLQVTFEQTLGLGEKFVIIGQSTLSVQYHIFNNTTLELRTPYVFTLGNLGSTAGVGDMIFSATQTVLSGQQQGISFLAGMRLKSNNANLKYSDNPLPMAYQTGLGSNDIITGILYFWKKWDFYMAYQHAFNRNKNQYLHPNNETNKNKLYYESAELKRGDDLYFRFQHSFLLKEKGIIKATLLNIYRLQKDQILKDNNNVFIIGSKGLTVNLGITFVAKLKDNKNMEWSLSFPVIDRKYRADGLTRNLVLSFRINL